MFSNNFLNISDFAKIAGVSRQTLIYYDRIGLFSPAVVAENKYRMYSHKQLDEIGIITILRDLGMPLKKIKSVLNDVSPETMQKTLRYQCKVLQDKIDKLTTLNEMTQIRLQQIETGMQYQNDDPCCFLKKIDAPVPFFVGAETPYDQDKAQDDIIIDFFETVEKSGLPLIFSFGYVKQTSDVLTGNYNKVRRMGFRVKNKNVANTFLPAGTYLIAYGKGDYGDTKSVYDYLLRFAEANALTLCENVYEEYLIDELAEKDPDRFVFQISVRVE